MKNTLVSKLAHLGLVILFLASFLVVSGQRKPFRGKSTDEIKAQKVAFITSQLALTADEAQVFWPIYNEYAEKREAIHKEMFGPDEPKGKPDPDAMTEKEAEQFLDQMSKNQQKMADLEKEYLVKFKKVLSAKKIVKLHMVENDFKRMLLKKLGRKDAPPPHDRNE
jgi:hypothetical protein